MQQVNVRRERAHRAHRGHDGLVGNVRRPARLDRFHDDVADCRVRAQQHVTLLPLELGQRVIRMLHLAHVAGHDARLAQAAGAAAAAVAEAQAGLQSRLQDRIVAFEQELVPARTHRHLRRDHVEHVGHRIHRLRRFGSQCAPQPGLHLVGQRGQHLVAARCSQSAQPLLAVEGQRVIRVQIAAQRGQLLSLREQPLGEDLLRRQHALAHALAERRLTDLHDLLQRARVFERCRRKTAAQVIERDQTVERLQLAGAHHLLQSAARYPHELCRACEAEELRHTLRSGRGLLSASSPNRHDRARRPVNA